MSAMLLVLAAFLLVFQLITAHGADHTIQAGASGPSVVRAVIDKVEAVFGNDDQFLRRVAYVESTDGTHSDTYRDGYHGGVWQVDETGFRDTQDVASHPGLTARYELIMQEFGIDWHEVEWTDLRKPLYSGLAARLKLLNTQEPIPCDVSGQAAYWKRHYNTELGGGTEQKFINDVRNLRSIEGCRVNSDIMFVLDTSSSIGSSEFNFVRDFVLQYLNNFAIGPNNNQIGVITFSNSAQVEFALDTYSDRESLEQAINDIFYYGGGTNIPAALCQLLQSYSSNSSGARLDANVFRVAVVMTDGQSNQDSNPCNFESVTEAARTVHAASPPIIVLAFGVGSEYDPQDVMGIASRPEYATSATSFGVTQLECVQTNQEKDICYKITTPVSPEDANTTRGSLDQGKQVRWQFDVPEEGITFSLRVEQGRMVMYASTQTTSPSEAFYEWKAETSSSTWVFIKPTSQDAHMKHNSEINNLIKRAIPVYMALIGLNEKNTFALKRGAGRYDVSAIVLSIVAVLVATCICCVPHQLRMC